MDLANLDHAEVEGFASAPDFTPSAIAEGHYLPDGGSGGSDGECAAQDQGHVPRGPMSPRADRDANIDEDRFDATLSRSDFAVRHKKSSEIQCWQRSNAPMTVSNDDR
jgi:hypothetical protein